MATDAAQSVDPKRQQAAILELSKCQLWEKMPGPIGQLWCKKSKIVEWLINAGFSEAEAMAAIGEHLHFGRLSLLSMPSLNSPFVHTRWLVGAGPMHQYVVNLTTPSHAVPDDDEDGPITIDHAAGMMLMASKTIQNNMSENRQTAPQASKPGKPAIYSYKELRLWLISVWPEKGHYLPQNYAAAVALFPRDQVSSREESPA
ncbi:MAG: hypothetical protein K8T25_06715 [Planctomycetia bacterium]|nr:hypothetical protein [Planctomycetia bacterium]